MWTNPWVWLGMGAAVAATGAVVAVVLRSSRRPNFSTAKKLFHLRREWLEARFQSLAAKSGKPRGLKWIECAFDDAVAFARDRHTGRLRALVAVTIRFRAIEGGGMEDNPNVGNLRAATAVFLLDGAEWSTDGRAIFNLNPDEAIRHFGEELEVVE